MSHGSFLTALALAAGLATATASAASAFQAISMGTFDAPVDIRYLPSQPLSLFVVEKPGRIMLMRNEVKQTPPFLDMHTIVQDSGERGLLSLAFAPDYAISFKFYVQFVNLSGDVEVDEFQSSAATPLRASLATRRILLKIPHPGASNHNGGQLQFGSDGLLYISVGDGGNTLNPGDPARKLNNLLGKILRIDPQPGIDRPYRIPDDNPFVGLTGRDEIFAYGLRNPWRFSFAGTVMAIGDVGQSTLEEVDMLPLARVKGSNFGWPAYEGTLPYDPSKPGPGKAKFPMFEYLHTGDVCAIIGGMVVHDQQLPALAGRYIYGDLCTGEIRSFAPDVAGQHANGDAAIGVALPGLTTFGAGAKGQIYMAAGTSVYRLEP